MSTRTDVEVILAQLDAEIATAERNVAALRVERQGAEAILTRLPASIAAASGPTDAPEVPAPSVQKGTPKRRRSNGNASLVADLLRVGGQGGMDLQSIGAATAASGTPLDYDQVRAAVAYLRKQGTAENIGRGVWRLTASTDTASPEAPGLAAVPTSSPEVGTTPVGEHAAHHVALAR